MKKLLGLAIVAIGLFLGCENENESAKVPFEAEGKLVENSECKGMKSMFLQDNTPDSLSCCEYSYNPETEVLTLVHVNAGFNCCPGELSVDVYSANDTIFIEEFEEAALCNCNCLFDLEIELNNIPQQSVNLSFIEPYAQDMEKLTFTINLNETTVGSVCATRKKYPWGVYSR